MKDKRDFDILENADDIVLDELSGVPALAPGAKKRILSESKRKLYRRQRNAGIKHFKAADQVSGVERYSRPKWRIFAGIAACFVLAGSVTVTLLSLNRGDKVPVKQYPTTPAAVTEESTTTSAEFSTDTTNSNEMYISPEMYEKYSDTAVELVRKMHELDSISRGAVVNVDMEDVKSVTGTGTDAEIMTYYKVTDDRFKTMDDFRNYVADFIAEPYYTQVISHIIDTEVSSYTFREIDGQLYVRSYKDYSVRANDMVNEITGTPEVDIIDDTTFNFKVATTLNGEPQETSGIAVLVDGKWKLKEISTRASETETTASDEQTTNDPESDPYAGHFYDEVSQRCNIEITKSDSFDTDYTYNVTVRWSSSAFDTTEWTFSGQFNGRGVLSYTNCESKHYVTTSDDSEPQVTVDYSNGTGYLSVSERGDKTGFVWNDDNFAASKDCFFAKD